MYFYQSVYLPSKKIKFVHNHLPGIIKHSSVANTRRFFYMHSMALRKYVKELTERDIFIDKISVSLIRVFEKCKQKLMEVIEFLKAAICFGSSVTSGMSSRFTGQRPFFRAGGKDPPVISGTSSRFAGQRPFHVLIRLFLVVILLSGTSSLCEGQDPLIMPKNQSVFALKTAPKTAFKSSENGDVLKHSKTSQGIIDEVVIRVDSNDSPSAIIGDPDVYRSHKNLPLSITMYDNINSSSQGAWRIVSHTGPVFENGNPPIRDGRIIYTANPISEGF